MSLPNSDSNTRPAGVPDSPIGPASGADATLVGPAASTPPPAPPLAPPPPASPPGGGPNYSLAILIGVIVLALIGIGLLGLGLYAVMRLNSTPAVALGPSTATLAPLSTQVVLVPSTTPAPPTATTTPTEAPSTTPLAATGTNTAPLTATASITPTAAGNLLTVNLGANVRTGPGVNYPAIGAIKAGDTAQVVGRDASGNWFVIVFSGGFGGRGWISGAVSTYSGDKSALPVIAAPPPPAPTATPKPAGNPNGGLVTAANGVSGNLNLCSSQVVFAVRERICFVEWIKNNTAKAVPYGILGVTAVREGGGVQFQTSWSGELASHGLLGIDPGCIGPTDRCKGQWEDGVRLNNTGTYQLVLTVCFSDFPTCRGTSGDWETLSGPIVVTVQ